MDTPNRNHNQRQPRQPWQPWQPQNGTPMCSQCQDSLVFNYLKNLSPIKTVESVHLAHALGFPAIPSVFKSPHIDIRKESKPLSRYPLSDMSKPEFFYQDGDERNLCMGVSNVVKLSDHIGRTQEDDNLMYTLDEPIVIPPDECSTRPTKQPESFQYDSGSPNQNNSLSHHLKSDFAMGSTSMLEIVHDDLQGNNQFSHMPEFGGVQQNEELREEQACDWENLISDDNDELLPFGSSSGFETFSFTTQNYIDHDPSCTFLSSRLPQNTTDNTLTTQPDGYFGDFHQNASGEFFAEQVREYTEKNEVDYTSQILSVHEQKSMRGEPIKKMEDGSGDCFISSDNKVLFQQQRVMRRRCLTFEMAGTCRNNLCNDSNGALSSLSHHGQFTSSDGQKTTLKPGIGHFTRTKPGIGLHLNAIASATKDVIAHDVCPSAKQPINMPCSISPFSSVPNGQETVNNPLSAEKDNPESNVKNLLLVQDFPQAPVCEKSDDLSHSSPKKKKRRIENGSDGNSCKRCNCKKSKCLKLYCECFAAGVYCVETCSCQGCLNKPQHEETVIQTRKQIESRNPLAFAPKVIRTPEPVSEIGEEANKTPASARHKRGCNCKKSSCLKKYCECYQGGVGCSISCRCEGCKNTFGRKDGTMPGGTEETGPEEAALDSHEKDAEKPDTQQNTYAQNDKQPSSENIPLTPSFTCRSCVQLPFQSSGKPPRSSMLSIGSTPKLSTAKEARVKFEAPLPKKHFQVPTDDETPDNLLRSNSSPISGVKVVSPSRKRISPPSNKRGVSPTRKGCRKLILKSIPSFPSLTSDSTDELHPSSSPSHLDSKPLQ